MSDIEERIRERAYRLWIEEGQPEGSQERHWAEARRMVDQEAEENVGLDNVSYLEADEAAVDAPVRTPNRPRKTRPGNP